LAAATPFVFLGILGFAMLFLLLVVIDS